MDLRSNRHRQIQSDEFRMYTHQFKPDSNRGNRMSHIATARPLPRACTAGA